LKIVFCGPPHSGKSVFIANLISKMPTDAYTIIRACPDGEGTWSNNKNQNETTIVRKKGEFTQAFIEDACQAIDNQSNAIVLVDVGGVISKENAQVFKHCDSFFVVSNDENKKREWLEFGQELGLQCVGCVDSSLDGQEAIYSRTPFFQGRITDLQRGKILENSSVINAVVSDIIRKSKYGEKAQAKKLFDDKLKSNDKSQFYDESKADNKPQADKETQTEFNEIAENEIFIDDTQLGFELGYGKEILTEDGTLIKNVRWEESALPKIYKAISEKLNRDKSYEMTDEKENSDAFYKTFDDGIKPDKSYETNDEKTEFDKSIRLNGIRANFVLCAIAKAAKQNGVKNIITYDIRTQSYIPIKDLPKRKDINWLYEHNIPGESEHAASAEFDYNISEVSEYDNSDVIEYNVSEIPEYDNLNENNQNNIRYSFSKGLIYTIVENKENIFMDIDIIKEKYSLEDYEKCILPQIQENKNLYISGRIPLWLLASISNSYDPNRIFTFQPGKGFTCISSANEKELGMIVDGVEGININQYFEDKKNIDAKKLEQYQKVMESKQNSLNKESAKAKLSNPIDENIDK